MQRIDAIILAGGSGSRFGGGKLLSPYGDGRLIDHAVRAAMAAPVANIILATGYDGDKVGEAVKALAAAEYGERTLAVVHADRHAEGVAETLKAGVAALPNGAEGAFIFLGDMPRIPAWVGPALARGIGEKAAAAPVFEGRRGHPVLFSARLFPSLLRLSGDEGARKVLDALADDLALISVEDIGVLFDVDHPSDIAS